jgi:hypothetical protein
MMMGFSFISFLAAMFLALGVNAAGIDNKGFVKDASPAVKERFSLCNEFLDVKWIDKSRSVGILKADVYTNGKSEPRFLIVHLERPGSKAFAARGNGIFYEISEKQYSSRDFEQFLHGARFGFKHHDVFLTVNKGKRSERFPQEPLPFEAFVTHQTEFPNRSFSDFSKTVCVVYPDGKQAFVAEARKPFAKLPIDDKSKQAYDTVAGCANEKCKDITRDTKTGCNMDYLKDSYALDINGDGKDDYIFLISAGQDSKTRSMRYLLSSKEGSSSRDVSGCLGFGRFFYGYADTKGFHLGRCR